MSRAFKITLYFIFRKYVKSKVFKTVGIALFMALLLPFISLLKYPQIVRSAYYKSPVFVFKAFYSEYLEKKAFSLEDAVDKVGRNGFEVAGDIKYLFLADDTGVDGETRIIDRYFALLSKWARPVSISSERFWHIPVQSGLVMFEADTGRMVYYKMDGQSDYTYQPVLIE